MLLNNRKSHISQTLKDEIVRLLILGLGVFIFILFFQPFPLTKLEYNERLLYVTGFGGIYFILSFLVLILLPILIPKWFRVSEWESGPPYALSFLLLAIASTAFAFYIRYVGNSPISFYIMFKVVLVCLLPIIALSILYKNKALERLILILKVQNKELRKRVREEEKEGGSKHIELFSANKSEKLSLLCENIIAIRSADNYIEVISLIEGYPEKKLLRNTLKDIEQQLSARDSFVRCHRTCLVNTKLIHKLFRDYSGYKLKMKFLEESLPVSRQFIVQVRDAVSVNID